jgi:hypothetical protein
MTTVALVLLFEFDPGRGARLMIELPDGDNVQLALINPALLPTREDREAFARAIHPLIAKFIGEQLGEPVQVAAVTEFRWSPMTTDGKLEQ